ncbi:hypothetical protein DUI87_08254 [Hirundo rustica rustica]|uniref:Uncharacterized protein n=1 Tax=Hirundo rustica rustica TaxID=333673 RepID=A0A3M0L9X6_HIRRU|nr:hypothetical protein DUI87_08254 [Hirundo rustica rustica]
MPLSADHPNQHKPKPVGFIHSSAESLAANSKKKWQQNKNKHGASVPAEAGELVGGASSRSFLKELCRDSGAKEAKELPKAKDYQGLTMYES